MSYAHNPDRVVGAATSYFYSDAAMRSRSVSAVLLSGVLDVPAPPARLLADWAREMVRLELEVGDVEAMPLARARARWPDYTRCVQAVSDWLSTVGLADLLASSEVALMACRGAHYHHDGDRYGAMAFCNLFLSEDQGLDVHFPGTGDRIALTRGTVLVFDTCQPHAVIPRHSSAFSVADFPVDQDWSQFFLTWELPLANAQVGRALDLVFDTDPEATLRVSEEQVWVGGARAAVCPATGRWHQQ